MVALLYLASFGSERRRTFVGADTPVSETRMKQEKSLILGVSHPLSGRMVDKTHSPASSELKAG